MSQLQILYDRCLWHILDYIILDWYRLLHLLQTKTNAISNALYLDNFAMLTRDRDWYANINPFPSFRGVLAKIISSHIKQLNTTMWIIYINVASQTPEQLQDFLGDSIWKFVHCLYQEKKKTKSEPRAYFLLCTRLQRKDAYSNPALASKPKVDAITLLQSVHFKRLFIPCRWSIQSL